MLRIVPWLWCLLGVLIAVGLATPSGARADGAVTLSGGELRFNSDSQDAENLVITRANDTLNCNPKPTPCLQLANGPQKIRDQVAGAACQQLIFNGAPFDTIVVCDTNVAPRIRLTLNDGDDFVRMGPNVPPATIDGGTDDDNLTSDSGADTVLGGPGDDTISDDGNSGNDVFDGGADNDSISLAGGNDDVAGGAGRDTVFMGTGDDTVRLDDVANDGPGGGSNVRSDVEVVEGGGGSDNLFGNAAANTLRGGSGNDLIDGGGGPDVLEGGTGADDLSGGPDVDRVVYSDTAAQTITLDDVRDDGAAGELDNVHSDVEDVAAGQGNDTVVGSGAANVLDGGDGDDDLTGGGGVDTYLGGAGQDELFARDGLAESVDCGGDADSAVADTIDSLGGCETVSVSSELVPDADGDGAAKPGDCDDGNAAIRPGAVDVPDNGIDEDCSGADAVNLDRDGDGSLQPSDCNDSDPRINPGAVDTPGNAVDEDCRGGDAPFPVIPTTIAVTFKFSRSFTVFTQLKLRRVVAGSTLRMTCKGKGCPFAKRTRRLERDRRALTLARPLRKARLRRGAKFEVRVTRPGMVGVVARYKVRAGKAPARTDRCLSPGAKRPSRCRT